MGPEFSKKSDREIPKPMQIFSIDATEGCIFFRYQEEIVDWGMPEFFARVYSDQFLFNLSSFILFNMSNFDLS